MVEAADPLEQIKAGLCETLCRYLAPFLFCLPLTRGRGAPDWNEKELFTPMMCISNNPILRRELRYVSVVQQSVASFSKKT